MDEFSIAISVLNKISIRGEDDAARILNVCEWIRKKRQENVEKMHEEQQAIINKQEDKHE